MPATRRGNNTKPLHQDLGEAVKEFARAPITWIMGNVEGAVSLAHIIGEGGDKTPSAKGVKNKEISAL